MKLVRTCILLLPFFSVLFAEPGKDPPTEPPAKLPPVEVSSTSLEIGAQFNPFANFFTKRLKYINVSRLKDGSVASRAGLRNGDRIIEICGLRLSDYKITDFPDIKIATVDRQVTVMMKVQRKGVPTALDITMVFPDFDGQFEWSIRSSTLQKKALPADDWPLDSSGRTSR
jgi:membrane-associated protease RseP (regulator of RpoE activity)